MARLVLARSLRISSNIKLSLPAVIFGCGYIAAVAATAAGAETFKRLEFPLEAVTTAALIGSIVVLFRLLPQRSDRTVRFPLVITVLVLSVWLLIGIVSVFTGGI